MDGKPTNTARDPVCGMPVDPATAKHHAEQGGITYFFCSGDCHAKFAADPGRYLRAQTLSPALVSFCAADCSSFQVQSAVGSATPAFLNRSLL